MSQQVQIRATSDIVKLLRKANRAGAYLVEAACMEQGAPYSGRGKSDRELADDAFLLYLDRFLQINGVPGIVLNHEPMEPPRKPQARQLYCKGMDLLREIRAGLSTATGASYSDR